MHGRIPIWLACALAVTLGGPGAARAQYAQPVGPDSYSALADMTQPVGQLVSAESFVAEDDLAARVKKLEDALKKAEDKAAADKKKAASKPTYKLRGRTYVDWATFSQDADNKAVFGNAQNGIGFRSARIGVEGEIFDVFEYCTEIDFVSAINDHDGTFIGNGVTFKEVWMAVNDLPLLGTLRVGNFKEPFSLEELTSSRFITFMERSLGNSVFTPAYNLGAMFMNRSEDERLLWQLGTFVNDIRDNGPKRDADNFGMAVTGRVVWLPWYDECTDGRGLLHLGAAYSYRDAYDAAHAFRSRDESSFGPYIINGGSPTLDNYNLFGAEAALVYGPFSIQSEYKSALLEYPNGTDAVLPAFYVQVSYFLTGENRGYKRDVGRFDRVKPFENFFRVRAEDGCCYTGKGAWEVAYRYDYCDLTEMGASAGLASTHTLGVNWYLCPYARIMADYVHGLPHKNYADAGTIDAFMMRYQIDF